ncbi:hypothetical protein NIES2119_06535 [[Phormidium ambiguum] IAM M-71]|uniref:Addiction module protein n=1 Tax=[Phormidium ambiguum] IAM M-71 TaxID=454136 RepID=A0A1U7IQ02_9CYAN|nr:hypothetical protein [Phormidium ambiguum]OKH39392.1 hypothetical protein NIES2119_06535 [Phormidium ambiguum IAM M-71]
MPTYEDILTQVKSLTLTDKFRLLEELKTIVNVSEEVEEDAEVMTTEEIAESEAAWEDYLAGRDHGISSKELKQRLLGENFD